MPPSPLVPVLANDNDVKRADAMAEPGSDRLLEVYSEYQKTMRKFLESQDQVFAALAGGTSTDRPVPLQPSAAVNGTGSLSSASIDPPGSVKPAAPAPVAQPVPIAPPPEVAKVTTPSMAVSADLPKVDDVFANQQTMQAFITEVLVDRTGYPPELLELDAHLESDLGIDSIKQVEVLGALIDAMPTAPDPAQMQEIRTAAREKQTIQELSSFMLALHAGKN
jgi:acyl carrier protein